MRFRAGRRRPNSFRGKGVREAAIGIALVVPGRAHADEGTGRNAAFVELDLHGSFLTNASDRSNLSTAFGYGASGGYHFGSWGVLLRAEQNLWLANELDDRVVRGAVNLALGAEYRFFDGRARTSFGAGPSILVDDTLVDEAGETGVFLFVRPVGIRWPVHEHWHIVFDPIYAAIVAPVLRRIPLVMVQYRTGLSLEASF